MHWLCWDRYSKWRVRGEVNRLCLSILHSNTFSYSVSPVFLLSPSLLHPLSSQFLSSPLYSFFFSFSASPKFLLFLTPFSTPLSSQILSPFLYSFTFSFSASPEFLLFLPPLSIPPPLSSQLLSPSLLYSFNFSFSISPAFSIFSHPSFLSLHSLTSLL